MLVLMNLRISEEKKNHLLLSKQEKRLPEGYSHKPDYLPFHAIGLILEISVSLCPLQQDPC